MPNALAVIALSERGTMFDPGPCVYMEKMAAAPSSPTCSTSTARSADTVELIAERKGTDVRDVMVVMLDRPRHEQAIREIRAAGARIRLIIDGDVSAALLAVTETAPVDLLWGIGGTPEGVISAAAIKCVGGALSSAGCGRATTTSARPPSTRATTSTQVLTQDDLVRGDDCFFSATGVTDGDVLQGVRYEGAAGGDDRVARDAVALGHRAADLRARTTATKLRDLRGERYG